MVHGSFTTPIARCVKVACVLLEFDPAALLDDQNVLCAPAHFGHEAVPNLIQPSLCAGNHLASAATQREVVRAPAHTLIEFRVRLDCTYGRCDPKNHPEQNNDCPTQHSRAPIKARPK